MSDDDARATVERLGLLAAAVLAYKAGSYVWEAGNTVAIASSQAAMVATWLLAFVTLGAAAAPRPPAWTRALVPLTLALVFVDYALVHAHHVYRDGVVVTTDLRLYQDQAARLVSIGQNPYAHDLRPAFQVHQATLEFATPLIDGDYSGRLAYPALSPLLLVPFVWAGIDTSAVYPLFFALTCLALWLAAPPRWRPLVLIPWFAEERYLIHSLGGVSDIVWAFFLVLVEARWERRRDSALCYGLACSFKQAPWVVGPLIVVRLWQETPGDARARATAVAKYVGWSFVPFTLLNGPFLLADPGAWLTGVTEPVIAPMITLGQGLSVLTTTGEVVIPHRLFGVFSLGALLLGTWAYQRHRDVLPELLWIVPGVALWFGHRSLTSYWYFYAIPMAVAIVRRRPAFGASPHAAWPTLAAVGAYAAVVLGVVLSHADDPPRFSVTPVYPIWTRGELVEQMDFDVVNTTPDPLRPRFAVQSRTNQPFFWTVRSGPLELAPGMAARYSIRTDVPFQTFALRQGARVTVADAVDYDQRTTVVVAPEVAYTHPGAVPNPDFTFWSGPAPTFWGSTVLPPGAGVVEPGATDRGEAPFARLRVDHPSLAPVAATAQLDTYVLLPHAPVEIGVWTPLEANQGPDPAVVFGVQLRVGRDYGWVLFGDAPGSGTTADGVRYVTVPVQRERVFAVTLDVPGVLAELGVATAPTRVPERGFDHVDYPFVGVNITPFLTVARDHGPIEARIAYVRSTAMYPDTDARFRHTQAHPEEWLRWVAAFHSERRNFDEAATTWEEVVRRDPLDGAAWFELAEARLWLGAFPEAAEGYRIAARLGHAVGRSRKGRAWALLLAGDREAALPVFDEAIAAFDARDPEDRVHIADCHKGKWFALDALHRCPEAEAAFTRAAELDTKILWRDLPSPTCTSAAVSPAAP